MRLLNKIPFFLAFLIISACATHQVQTAKGIDIAIKPNKKEVAHTFYLIGDAGNADLGSTTPALQTLSKALEKADKTSTLLFLGDNVYPKGLDNNSAVSKHRLQIQIDAVKDFKGRTLFIPGNHDWYLGMDALKDQEKMIEKALGKDSFLPENGCPLERVKISDTIDLIVIDTHWYVTNWDKHPKINDNCEIKTRAKFMVELEGLVKKARGKTTLIAMHHPAFTYGPHGGKYDLKSHLSPFPVLGTLKNILRKTTGVSNADLQNKRYNELKKYIVTLAQQNEKTILLSGHEHTLQYIVEKNIPQIISGSGSKENATKLGGGALFTSGKQGFAKLTVYKDGNSFVEFIDALKNEVIFKQYVLKANNVHQTLIAYPKNFDSKATAAIYKKEATKKSGYYKFFWGERYRKYFGTDVEVPTVDLDTLFGGLTPVRKGGGHQSKSLRLETKDGREFVMRALKKNAVQYLQTVIFKDQFIQGQFNDTYTEGLVMDVFAGAHPYAPFVVGELSDAVEVYHTNPVLYYVPKQDALGSFNNDFGNELYMIEERAASGHGNQKSFGFANEIISTDDLVKKLIKDDKYQIDEDFYLRARLFDMLIGDWDRHDDQWRWAKFKKGKQTYYRPVPRDRDQAFSKMADGFLLGFASKAASGAALLQSYDDDLKNPVAFNMEPYPLDVLLLTKSTREDWKKQVEKIVTGLTDEVIENAFKNMPKEVQDETISSIKSKLKGRKRNLQKIADIYYKHVLKYQVVRGTDKDNLFEIERLESGTKVAVFNIKKGKKGSLIHQRTYLRADTKELWIYGLDDDDVFEVKGKGITAIKLRLIGGQNKDTYTIENNNNVVVYDYKSKKSIFNGTVKKRLRDDYESNVYDYKKLKNNATGFFPLIAGNPDDGLAFGFTQTAMKYGFERNPFTYKHAISGSYYTATSGFDLSYVGEFAHVIGKGNLELEAKFTSPNFSRNFFGYGNETVNIENSFNNRVDGLNYNRVKIKQLRFTPALVFRGQLGSEFKLGASYEAIEIENTQGRFINTTTQVPATVFNNQQFVGAAISYHFKNSDNAAFPTLGMETNFQLGYKSNLDQSTSFGYFIPSISFDYKLVNSGDIVLATKFFGHLNFGDDFEFYQAASIGGNNGLRGYRNERFTGKSAYYQSTDIRIKLKQTRTSITPIHFGIYGGFDYGKVWIPNLPTGDWNTSVGGGIFLNMANVTAINIGAFNSDDGMRLAFKVGFGF